LVFMEWNQKYLTGIKAMDSERSSLFDRVNRLYETITNGEDQRTVGKMLDELIEYYIQHFLTEERLFQEFDYPQYAEHKQEHDELALQMFNLQMEFQKQSIVVAFEVLSFLNDWLLKHNTGADLRFAEFLKMSRGRFY